MKTSIYDANIEGLTSKGWQAILDQEAAFEAEQEELAISEAEAVENGEQKIYSATFRITERPDSTPFVRYFDAWLDGCANVVSRPQVFALNSHDIIAWRVNTERELWEFSQKTGATITLDIIHENY